MLQYLSKVVYLSDIFHKTICNFIEGKVFDNKSAGWINCADAEDFRKVYNATMQPLFKVAYRIVNDEEAAEDLVHDSYIKANEKALVFPSMDDAKYWLIRVVKNEP